MFKHFTKRLERDIKKITTSRFEAQKARLAAKGNSTVLGTPMEVNVVTHPFQRFAVWFGGSMLASQPDFLGYFHTAAQYAEKGPSICRSNPAFASVT